MILRLVFLAGIRVDHDRLVRDSNYKLIDQPGEYAFICHLPGHEAYGMRGVVRVVE